MLDDTLHGSMKTLAVIPARGGSKGLKRKCSLPVAGIPLLARSARTASAAKSVARVIVSTDDPDFAQIARDSGADIPFLRPAELAGDLSPVIDAVIHLLEELERMESYSPDAVALLQPTAPFTLAQDIDGAFKLLCDTGADAVVSACKSEIKPDWLRRLSPEGWVQPIVSLDQAQHTPRQLMPETYRLNGAIYWVKRSTLLEKRTFLPEKTSVFEMPQMRSVDIDSEHDIKLANFIAKEYGLE